MGGGDKDKDKELLDRECSSPTRVHLRRTGDRYCTAVLL